MGEQHKRMGSNLTDEQLKDIKNAVCADATVWGYFLKYCVVGFPEWGREYYAYRNLAKQARPDANDFAIGVAAGDLRDEATRSQGMDPWKAMLELDRILKEEVGAGRLPKQQGKEGLIELFERAGGRGRSSQNSS